MTREFLSAAGPGRGGRGGRGGRRAGEASGAFVSNSFLLLLVRHLLLLAWHLFLIASCYY